MLHVIVSSAYALYIMTLRTVDKHIRIAYDGICDEWRDGLMRFKLGRLQRTILVVGGVLFGSMGATILSGGSVLEDPPYGTAAFLFFIALVCFLIAATPGGSTDGE